MTTRPTITRFIGAGSVAWLHRFVSKVMCKFPALIRKPVAKLANISGALGLSIKTPSGAGTLVVMNNTFPRKVYKSEDGGKTWSLAGDENN